MYMHPRILPMCVNTCVYVNMCIFMHLYLWVRLPALRKEIICLK